MVDRGPAEKAANGAARLRQRFPTIDDLRRRARARVPRFGFDFVDGGATEEYCMARNTSAFQAIELLPHYCIDGKATTETELFGRTYAAPIGVAPMGSAGLMWPGAEKLFAAEAQARRIPYVLATPGNASIEEIAAIAPDVFWFQLYRFAKNEHAIGFELIKRADAAGVQSVLLPPETTDAFAPKAVRAGMGAHFRLSMQAMDWDQVRHFTGSLDLRVFLADAGGRSCWETDLRQPLALIIGGEAQGATEPARALAREQLSIPMPGRAESLNAAAAGSVLMFEVVRQRR